jgi:hypothetical protein
MIFEGWIPHTDGFGYSGEANTLTYSGRWRAPYSTLTLTQARNLIDPAGRFLAAANATIGTPSPAYAYKEQIEHSLVAGLTAQRMTIKPLNDFNAYSMDTLTGNSNDGLWTSNATAKISLKTREIVLLTSSGCSSRQIVSASIVPMFRSTELVNFRRWVPTEQDISFRTHGGTAEAILQVPPGRSTHPARLGLMSSRLTLLITRQPGQIPRGHTCRFTRSQRVKH